MAFSGKYPIRTKIVVDDKLLEQIYDFNCSGYSISFDCHRDWNQKLSRFRRIFGTICSCLKNKLGRTPS